MDNIINLVQDLAKLRTNVPQLLFINSIDGKSFVKVRKEVIEYKAKNPDCKEIDVIIQSPGGLADDAYRIIRTLRKNFETVNIVVPFWAKSAATLLTLGASNIIMDEAGEFGPLDAQVGKAREDSPEYDIESALNDEHSLSRIETRFKEMIESMYVRMYEHKKINIPKSELSSQLMEHLSVFYEPLLRQINPYKLGEKRRILDIGGQYANRILIQFGSISSISHARVFVDFLVNGCPDHGYVIDYDLISPFLKSVKLSSEFGSDYKNKLTEISFKFIELAQENSDFVHIGFVSGSFADDLIKGVKDNITKDGMIELVTDVPANGKKKTKGTIK